MQLSGSKDGGCVCTQQGQKAQMEIPAETRTTMPNRLVRIPIPRWIGFAAGTYRTSCGSEVEIEWRMPRDWAQGGPYRRRRARELERVLGLEVTEDELVLELHLPIDENAVARES